jgi:hypothetical protein
MARKTYETWQQQLAAYWQRIGYGGKWIASEGALKDEVEYRARAAVLERFPDYAATDAINAIGLERQLERPNSASDAAFATKLKQAFERWYWGGTAYGLLREFAETMPGALGLDYRVFLQWQRNDWVWELQAQTGTVTIDLVALSSGGPAPTALSFGTPTRWNTFIIEVTLTTSHPWYDAVPSNSSDAANTARRVVQRWRAQHSECAAIIIRNPDGADEYEWLWGMYDPNYSAIPAWGTAGLDWGDAPAGSTTTYWSPPVPQ